MTRIFLSWVTLIAEPYVALAIVLTVFVVLTLFKPALRAASQPGIGYREILRCLVTAAAFFGLTVVVLATFLLLARMALAPVKTEPITNSTPHATYLELKQGALTRHRK